MSRALQLELLAELALSARPEITSSSPLIPIEPRIGISIGLRYRVWEPRKSVVGPPEPTRDEALETPTDSNPEKPDATVAAGVHRPEGRISVDVLDSAGHPLSDAVVELSNEQGVRRLDFQSGATYTLEGVDKGRAQLKVKADLMREWSKDIEISDSEPMKLEVTLALGETSGQIRGLVRGFDGKPLAAHVHIEPGGHDVSVSDDGGFSVNVDPGKYRVKIELEGYEPQLREVAVRKNGVMVLNVDLKKGR